MPTRSAGTTPLPVRPFAWVAMLILALISTMSLGVVPASAADGVSPSGDTAQNIPGQGSCGVGNNGTYVKFTTGGNPSSTGERTATTTAGQTYVATYVTDYASGTFQITSLVDTANPNQTLYFSSVVGAQNNGNPIWKFAPTTAPNSPKLAISETANFTQFALCAYTNQTFQVKKVVTGTTTTQAFPITITCTLGTTSIPVTGFSLTNGQTSAAITVPNGSSCDATDSVSGYTTTSDGPLSVTKSGGLITVTNARQLASLKLNKVQAGGANRDWHFDVTCSNAFGESYTGTATINGSGSATLNGIPVGLSCAVTERESNSGGFTTSVDATGGVVTVGDASGVTFTNTRDLTKLTVVKQQVGGAARDWTFAVHCTNSFGDVKDGTLTIHGSGSATLDGIPTNDDCTVTETGDALFTTAPALVQTIDVGTAGTASVTFTNTRNLTNLTITKNQVGGAAQTWTFAITCPANAAGDSFTGSASVSGSGSATVEGIPTGLSCTVTENEANVSPFDTTAASVKVTAGGTAAFTNTKRADVTVVKTQNGGAPTYVYTFTLTGGPDGVSLSRSTTPGSTTPLDFGLVKPGAYTLCETGLSAGTTSGVGSLPGATTDATLGNVCAPITVTAGTNVSLPIDNVVGEGGRRTIGYWKNWNTCTSNAGQLANAAKTGKKLLDNVLPLNLGSYAVTTCQNGVAILSNASAKYAENALAAQLLAAEANVAVGGSAPQKVTDAIAQANALLTTVGYKGTPSSIIGSNSPYRAQAVALATILDQFNNGLLG